MLFAHFEMLCFTENTLPWYMLVYKWCLYVFFALYQRIFL